MGGAQVLWCLLTELESLTFTFDVIMALAFRGQSWRPIVDRQAKACLSNASVQRIFVDRHFLPTQSALIPRCRSGSGCAIAAPACHGETDLGQALFCVCGMEDAFFGLWVRFVIR